jgi:hypothetical protein
MSVGCLTMDRKTTAFWDMDNWKVYRTDNATHHKYDSPPDFELKYWVKIS